MDNDRNTFKEMTPNLLSIIIPVRYDSDSLRLSLKSLKENSKLNYEIVILVDVAPSWQTMDLLEKELKIPYHNVPLCNQYAMWNKGAEIAKGDYLAFVQSDDIYGPDWDTNLFQYMNDHRLVTPVWVEWHNTGLWFGAEPGPNECLQDLNCDDGRNQRKFNMEEFKKYCLEHTENRYKLGGGTFHPLVINKNLFNECGKFTYFTWNDGGHLHHESGLKCRVLKKGGTTGWSMNSFTYHFGTHCDPDHVDEKGWKFYYGRAHKPLKCRDCGKEFKTTDIIPWHEDNMEENAKNKREKIDPIMFAGSWKCREH